MIKHLFSFVVICLIACGSVVPTTALKKDIKNITNGEDKILWSSNRKLTWNDFQGKPRKNRGSIRAETNGEIITEKTYWENGVPKFEIRCYFLKDKSWTITNDSLTLQHEQIHFDIYELFTREIRKSFDSLNTKKVVDFDVYGNIFSRFLNENDSLNDKYDDEVRFDRLEQAKWIERVAEELEKLKQYEYKPN